MQNHLHYCNIALFASAVFSFHTASSSALLGRLDKALPVPNTILLIPTSTYRVKYLVDFIALSRVFQEHVSWLGFT